MHERLHEPDEQRGDPPRPGIVPTTFPFASDAQMITALQRSAGNQSVTRMLLREPTAAPPVAGPENGIVPMLQAFWPDDTWTSTRLALDCVRIVPGLGFVTGLGADVMAAWDDVCDVPTSDTVLFALTEGLIVFRSGVNIVSNGAASLLSLGQIAQWALAAMTLTEAGGTMTVPVVGVVTIPAIITSGVAAAATLAGNQVLNAILAETSGVLAATDFLITLDAGIWAAIGPQNDRDQWAELGLGYMANTMADFATMFVALAGAGTLNAVPSGAIANVVDTATTVVKIKDVARQVITSLIASFWNVRGGDVLERSPAPGRDAPQRPGLDPDGGFSPRPEPVPAEARESVARQAAATDDDEWRVALSAARGCFERGDAVLGAAQADWAEMLGIASEGGAEAAAEALEGLRAELPALAGEMEARVAVAQDVVERLPGALETIDSLEGHLDELLETVGGLALPLDQLPDDAGGMALRTALAPVASALETARETAIAPLQELRGSTEQLRTLLTTVAQVAGETLGLYREALARTTDALAEADDMGDVIALLAEQTAGLAASGDSVDLGAAHADWRALGAEIAQAEAAL